MKKIAVSLFTSLALAFAVTAAETSVTLSDVHLCCQGCVDGAQHAVDKVKDVTATINDDAKTVILKGPDAASVQKAADALVAAGYFGKSSDPNIKLSPVTGAKGEKVQTLKVEGVHLCCGKCVTAVNKVVESVPGAAAHTAKKNAKTFEVTGDFNDKAFFDALQDHGLSGKVAK